MHMLLVLLSSGLVHARTYFVYRGGVVMGRAVGAPARPGPKDLIVSRIEGDARGQLRRRGERGALRCELKGYPVLVRFSAVTGQVITRFRVRSVGACRQVPVRAVLAAHRL